jgi:hypothetical protein
LGAEETSRTESGPDRSARHVGRTRFRVFWWWALAWGSGVAVAAAVAGRVMSPSAQAAGPVLLKSASCLAAAIGFGAVAYYLVVFAQNRTLRELFLGCAFAGVGAGGGLQAAIGTFVQPSAHNDHILLISWGYASFLFAGAAYAQSSLRRGGFIRSVMQLTIASAAMAAFPAVLTAHAIDPILRQRLYFLGGASIVGGLDSILALTAAGLIAIAVVRSVKSPREDCERLDRVLINFYVACALGLVCRGEARSVTDIFWFSAQVLPVSAWLVFTAGFAAESAFAHKELLGRIHELGTLHEISWSLVGWGGEDFLRRFIDVLREQVGAEIAAVYLADPGRHSLELAAVSGSDGEYPRLGTVYMIESENRRPGFHTGHTADAFRSCKTRTADDVFVDPEFVPWRVIARGDGRAVSLPLIEKGSAYGVLNVYFRHRKQMPRESLSLLTTIAAATGPAIKGLWAQRHAEESDAESVNLAA